jgi:hypothetical protein
VTALQEFRHDPVKPPVDCAELLDRGLEGEVGDGKAE